jgi:hypothetical protein
MSDNFFLGLIKKHFRSKRTVENLTNDLLTYLASSPIQSGKTGPGIALPSLVRAYLMDETFAAAINTVSGKMLDLFDSK